MNYEDERGSKSGRRHPKVAERRSGNDSDHVNHWCPTREERDSKSGGRHLGDGVVYAVSEHAGSIDEFVEREVAQNQESNVQASPSSFSVNSMHLEMIRLASFYNFPSSSSVSTIKLARQGFYFSGEGDKVICFACGFEKSDWRVKDDVESIHRLASPNCPLLKSNCARNVEIGRRQVDGYNENSGNRDAHQLRGASGDLSTMGISSEASKNALSNSQSKQTTSNGSFPADDIQRLSSEKPPRDSHTRTRAQQAQINAFMQDLDPLGINFDRPKYPSYSVLAVRISSFTDWPNSMTQTPRDLATAGFLYAGYGDYTRCFFCGGGLRNWEPGDEPWTEHARWFPKCAFLRQNKGDEFVALVQIEHQEQEALERLNGHAAYQDNGSQNSPDHLQNSPNSDVTTFPAFQSLMEMGYSQPTIQRAFDILKDTKAPMHIKAEELLEVILTENEAPENDVLLPVSTGSVHQSVQDRSEQSVHDRSDVTGNSTTSVTMAVKDDVQPSDSGNLQDVNLKPTLSLASVEDTKSLIEENRKLKDLRLCKICMEKDASIAMLPCGHLCCCADCAPAMRKCPICRQFVKGTVRTWLV
ncbi:putative inhibitor of apoptosis [Ostrea edulis]|uniref:putative inhibitor of apoptosis n=1 Tax=Ostrea edulis TaxID=37623 RepID=UPI0024AEBF5B|nr:putative inhibitor of apoptosis [Ostrea edulis]XP_048765605.2 putative inhibitor of apoptosis [Ostrea edulis]XP_056015121.1 putative inhibitor of apoptosis [Ostrea edulis]